MSCYIIKDGTGTGNNAKVDKNKRLHVDSSSRTEDEQAALIGQSYNINTGTITLTSDGTSAVCYLKYNGDQALVIKEILGIVGSTTGGSGDAEMKLIKNPTAGTIISGATNVTTNQNRDFSSANIFDGLAYKGSEGLTITDGVSFADTTRSSFGTTIAFDASSIVLRKGNSIGVTFTPPSGNTSQTIKIAITCFVETADLSQG